MNEAALELLRATKVHVATKTDHKLLLLTILTCVCCTYAEGPDQQPDSAGSTDI